MHLATRLLITTALAATASLALANSADTRAREQWHTAIEAGYQQLSSETRALATRAPDYCRAPDPETRTRLEQAWLDAFLAWQQVRFVDFGPVENNNLSWQFQFWPDPKNLIARKAGYLIGSDQSINARLINDSGVAVQGFPMMEYLLFDQTLNSHANALPAARTCALLSAVATHAASNAEQLHSQWQAFRPRYLDTPQYRDATIRAGMTALEVLEERRLGQPMGLRGNGRRNPYITDAWRSGNSLRTVEATITGLQGQFLPGLAILLEASGDHELVGRIRDQFAAALANFPAARLSATSAFGNDEQFRVVQGLYVDISQLAVLINDQAAVSLGVVRGFNSSDGD